MHRCEYTGMTILIVGSSSGFITTDLYVARIAPSRSSPAGNKKQPGLESVTACVFLRASFPDQDARSITSSQSHCILYLCNPTPLIVAMVKMGFELASGSDLY